MSNPSQETQLRAELVALVMSILGEEFEKHGEQLADKVMTHIDAIKASVPVTGPGSAEEAQKQVFAVASAGMTAVFQTTSNVLGLIAAVMKDARRGA